MSVVFNSLACGRLIGEWNNCENCSLTREVILYLHMLDNVTIIKAIEFSLLILVLQEQTPFS